MVAHDYLPYSPQALLSVHRYRPDARFGFIMILRVLMQFKLSSCFATPSESVAIAAVLVVDCPNLHRPHAFIPPLHPSSITLAALILFALFLIANTYYPSQSHYNIYIYTLQQKSSIFPYKSRKTYCRSFIFSSVTVKREGKENLDSTRLDSTRLATCPGQLTGR